MKKIRIASYLAVGLTFCVATVVMPIFSAPPAFVALNIVGITLVSYGLGPVAGAAFGAFTHVALNSFGMGSGIIGFIVLTRLLEGFLPGAVDKMFTRREHGGWLSPLLGALLLTALIKPTSTSLAWLLSSYAADTPFLSYLSEEMQYFFNNRYKDTLAAYVFSCMVGWIAARGLDTLLKHCTAEKSQMHGGE